VNGTLAFPEAGRRDVAVYTRDQLDAMPTEQLVDAIQRLGELTDFILEQAALIYAVMESRGLRDVFMEAARAIKNGLILKYVPKVAAGLVDAGAAQKFGEKTMRYVGKLPPAKQKALANDERVPVVEPTQDGLTVRMLTVEEMDMGQVRQVFDDGVIRTPKEQEKIIARKMPAPDWKPGEPVEVNGVVYDPVSRTFRFGKAVRPVDDVIAVLRQSGWKVFA